MTGTWRWWVGTLGRRRWPDCTCGSGQRAQGYWPDFHEETTYCARCIFDKMKEADRAVRALAARGPQEPRMGALNDPDGA